MESSLVLTAGEEVQATLKGELFAVSTNLLVNVIMKIVQFLLFLQGYRKEAQLIVTNKRVVLDNNTKSGFSLSENVCFFQ